MSAKCIVCCVRERSSSSRCKVIRRTHGQTIPGMGCHSRTSRHVLWPNGVTSNHATGSARVRSISGCGFSRDLSRDYCFGFLVPNPVLKHEHPALATRHLDESRLRVEVPPTAVQWPFVLDHGASTLRPVTSPVRRVTESGLPNG